MEDKIPQSSAKARRDIPLEAKATGVAGLVLFTGPNITAGLAGLPQDTAGYFQYVGAVLVLRTVLAYLMANR